MQQPTLKGVRIRSSQDVHRIFHGVRIGRLKMLERRLDNEEREALTSGCVYVWEERGSRNMDVTGEGMDRFTEGKQWGPSRVRDQTYSAWFDTPSGRRKWHLSAVLSTSLPYEADRLEAAYFSDSTIDGLCTIDELPVLQDVQPPPGTFECAKSSKSKSRRRQSGEFHSQKSNSPAPAQDPHVSSTYSSEPVTMIQPYLSRESKLVTANSLSPMQPPTYEASIPKDISDNPRPWSTPSLRGESAHDHAPSRHRFSLPPFNTFIYPGDLSRTPSPADSGIESSSSCWEPTRELSSYSEGSRDSARDLAPIHGPKRRVYVRDPIDDKALRSLPR
ncbi:hypothetical protein C0992_005626 [Termitomyces sp. T32_za158]|nr:hypothetical protein C0992_005626 [Termitomyces sp. T32_za158]